MTFLQSTALRSNDVLGVAQNPTKRSTRRGLRSVHVKVNRSRFRLRRIRELLTHTQMDFLNPSILQRLDELSLVAERRRETPPRVALPRDLGR